MEGFGAGKGSLPRAVDGETFRDRFSSIDFSSLRKQETMEPEGQAGVEKPEDVAKLRLRMLAHWCEKRASGEHDTATTVTMLRKKVEELAKAISRVR
jgi:hypothetical protein